MADSPQYTAIPRLAMIQCSAANGNADGTGTMGAGEFQSGANGSRIDRVIIKAVGVTTAGMIRLFAFKGADKGLLAEFEIKAVARSKSVAGYEGIADLELQVPTGWIVRAATENAEPINVFLMGGDY